MNWKQSCRERLPEYLDRNHDLVPPWAKFPHYERYCIGWRMGSGEDWIGLWHVFLEQLDSGFETRLAYLRRHPPAPMNWADMVQGVLHPPAHPEDDDPYEDEPELGADELAVLLELGLLASDIAFTTWLDQQQGVRWPWTYADTPVIAARHWTRDLWFWSRQVAGLRATAGWEPPQLPAAWRACAPALQAGGCASLDLRQGLLSLAQMLCAGEVAPPWRLGLVLADFADSFEDDMGYVDAFRLWGMAAFDDLPQLQHYLALTEAPPEWRAWLAQEVGIALE